MPDEYVEVKRTGLGKNIVVSIVGVFVGIVLFIVSFIVLWSNEGRVNLGKVAENSVIVKPSAVKSSAENKLVSLTGPIEITKPVGDPKYLRAGKYVVLNRIAEMYAWIEEKETETKKKTGGGTEEKTTYRYKKGWTSDPEESSEFKIPEGHRNPRMTVNSETFYASDAKIGIYNFDPQSATMPSPIPVTLTTTNAITSWNTRLIGREYLFIGKGRYDQPNIGDTRISFEAVNAGKKVTLFGKMLGKEIVAYYHKGKNRLYRALSGTRNEAIIQLKTEHKVMGWILRIVGFAMMWIGLTLIFGPISAVIDVLPLLGKVSRILIGVFTFIVAFVLSIITIIVSMILHNTIVLIILLILIAVLIFLLLKRKKKPAQAS